MIQIYRPRGGGGFSLRFRKIHFLLLRSYSITTCGIFIGERFIDLRAPIDFLTRLLERCRRPFPYMGFYGIRCCDHGGRVMRSYPFFAWNFWHLGKLWIEFDKASDGPAAVDLMGPREYLRALHFFRKHGPRGPFHVVEDL